MGNTIEAARWDLLDNYLALGYTITNAAKAANIGFRAAKSYVNGESSSSGVRLRKAQRTKQPGGPVPLEDLKGLPARALQDVGLFGRRYFGLKILPWQEEEAQLVMGWLRSPQEEWAVVNQPPGSGKSAWHTRVLPAWVTVQDRRLRGMIGSANHSTATWYTDLLRMDLAREYPLKAKPADLRQGIAMDAEATLLGDYGRFRPLTRGHLWMRDRFRVVQFMENESGEKEPTWSAFGIDSGFLGGRYDLIVWDDLYDPRTRRTESARTQLKSDYIELCESRLEPGGLFILQGQRLGPDDIYRFALDMKAVNRDGQMLNKPKYHHIVYKAHYEDRCKPEHHKPEAKPYPQGCLLFPRRLSFEKLETLRQDPKTADKFRILYQQEDLDPANQLVEMPWIKGGLDSQDYEAPGCLDQTRGLGELPPGIDLSQAISVLSADPSPTRFWGVTWWVYVPASQHRYLVDIEQRRMEAPDFLQWNPESSQYEGLLEAWWKRSAKLKAPIKYVIVERNAAQRFLLQYEFVRRWAAKRGVSILGHDTHSNKTDPDRGVWTIGSQYRFGRVRLPWGFPARLKVQRLVDELIRYPEGTTDLTMSHWMFEFNLPRLYVPRKAPHREKRPSWVGEYNLSGIRKALTGA
jgi:hypothetical protein